MREKEKCWSSLRVWISMSRVVVSLVQSNRTSLHSPLTHTTCTSRTQPKSSIDWWISSIGESLMSRCRACDSNLGSSALTLGLQSSILIVRPPFSSRRAGSIKIKSCSSNAVKISSASAWTIQLWFNPSRGKLCCATWIRFSCRSTKILLTKSGASSLKSIPIPPVRSQKECRSASGRILFMISALYWAVVSLLHCSNEIRGGKSIPGIWTNAGAFAVSFCPPSICCKINNLVSADSRERLSAMSSMRRLRFALIKSWISCSFIAHRITL